MTRGIVINEVEGIRNGRGVGVRSHVSCIEWSNFMHIWVMHSWPILIHIPTVDLNLCDLNGFILSHTYFHMTSIEIIYSIINYSIFAIKHFLKQKIVLVYMRQDINEFKCSGFFFFPPLST